MLGASDSLLKPGGRVIDYLRRHAFRGSVFPVNPQRSTVQGLPTRPSLEALPQRPDAVVIALPAESVGDAVEQCIRAGARLAIVYASGYAELRGDGVREQERLRERAGKAGLRLLGPNTQGFADFATGTVLHFGAIIDEVPAQDGSVAVISQSGAGSQIVYSSLRRRGVGVRYIVATGNEADIDVAAAADALLDDPDVRLLLLYLESMRDPGRLACAARKARERDVPMLVAKAGRTQGGQRMAASHTGALAGEDALVDSFLHKHGILRVADFEELAELGQLFQSKLRPRQRRVVAISNSGATCVLAADAVEHSGLKLASLDEAARADLRLVLPDYVSVGNPVDMTTALLKEPDMYADTLDVIARHGSADMVFAGFPIGGKGYDLGRFASQTRAFSDRAGIPVAVATTQDWVSTHFHDKGVPVFPSERRAIHALAMLARHVEITDTARQRGNLIERRAETRPACGQYTLDEATSLRVLADAGLPVVAHRVCANEDSAVAAWLALGGSVAVKGVSADVTHKFEHGLVRLGCSCESEVRAACRELGTAFERLGTAGHGFLVARMVRGEFELAAGAQVDPTFGPVVMIGSGGVLVEVLRDVQFLHLPIDADEACEAIRRLHIARAFGGARGLPPVDENAVARVLVGIGRLMAAQPDIVSIDANPMIVGRGSDAAAIVDAVVVRSRQDA